MTDARVSQVATEVLRTNLSPSAQVSQLAVEVLRPNASKGFLASAGSFALTGKTIAFSHVFTIFPSKGSFTLSGQAAAFARNYVMTVAPGSIALTGRSASLHLANDLDGAYGSFTLTGQAATLKRVITFYVAPGAFTLTGYNIKDNTPRIVDEALTFTDIATVRLSAASAEMLRIRETTLSRTVLSTSQNFATTDALAYAFRPGAIIAEVVALAEVASPTFRFAQSLADRVALADALSLAYPVEVADETVLADAADIVRGMLVLEQLKVVDTATPAAKFYKQFVDALKVNDALRRFFGGELADTVATLDSVAYAPVIGRVLADTVGIADALTQKLVIRITAADGFDVDASTALRWIFRPTLADGVKINAGYVAPNGTFTTWAVNTRTGAVSEYQSYEFNSFAGLGHKYLGASSSGLYELNGDTDAGQDIIAHLKSGYMQLGGSKFTSFKAAYLGMRADGDVLLKLDAGDGSSYTYQVVVQNTQTTKVRIGKGLRARYFAFELISTGQDFDLDSVEFVPIVTQRRV